MECCREEMFLFFLNNELKMRSYFYMIFKFNLFRKCKLEVRIVWKIDNLSGSRESWFSYWKKLLKWFEFYNKIY